AFDARFFDGFERRRGARHAEPVFCRRPRLPCVFARVFTGAQGGAVGGRVLRGGRAEFHAAADFGEFGRGGGELRVGTAVRAARVGSDDPEVVGRPGGEPGE